MRRPDRCFRVSTSSHALNLQGVDPPWQDQRRDRSWQDGGGRRGGGRYPLDNHLPCRCGQKPPPGHPAPSRELPLTLLWPGVRQHHPHAGDDEGHPREGGRQDVVLRTGTHSNPNLSGYRSSLNFFRHHAQIVSVPDLLGGMLTNNDDCFPGALFLAYEYSKKMMHQMSD